MYILVEQALEGWVNL